MFIVTMSVDGEFRTIGRQLSVTIDSRGDSTHEIGVLLTNRLVTLIIGSCEPIQATTLIELLSLRVQPGLALGGGSPIR